MYENLAILCVFAFAYSVLAGRLARTPINGAVVYLTFGVIAGPVGLGLLDLSISIEGIRMIAELTLALVLFTDASNADLAVLRRAFQLPQRMLLFGLPLTILLGVGNSILTDRRCQTLGGQDPTCGTREYSAGRMLACFAGTHDAAAASHHP